MYLGRCIHINIKEPVLFPARVHIKPRIAVRAGIRPEVSSDTYSKCYHGQTCLSVNSSKTMMKWDLREVSRASDSWFLTQLWKGLKEVPEPNQSRGGGKKLLLPEAARETWCSHGCPLPPPVMGNHIFASCGLISFFSDPYTILLKHSYKWISTHLGIPANCTEHPKYKYQPQPSPSPLW